MNTFTFLSQNSSISAKLSPEEIQQAADRIDYQYDRAFRMLDDNHWNSVASGEINEESAAKILKAALAVVQAKDDFANVRYDNDPVYRSKFIEIQHARAVDAVKGRSRSLEEISKEIKCTIKS